MESIDKIIKELSRAYRRFLRDSPVEDWFWALVVFIAGVAILKLLTFLFSAIGHRLVPERHAPMLSRILRYGGYALVTIIALNRAGIDLGVLLGAAGILTVAIGFASQTSASNVISGLFLVGERPFIVGDIIRVENIIGTVVAIDFVSVKLKTFDNLYARIPNEILFKSTIVNQTHYQIRRIDIEFPLAPEADIPHLRDRIMENVARIPNVLDEPTPEFQILGFNEAGVHSRVCAWTVSPDFRHTRTKVCLAIIMTLREQEATLPGPRRHLFAGTIRALEEPLITDPDLKAITSAIQMRDNKITGSRES